MTEISGRTTRTDTPRYYRGSPTFWRDEVVVTWNDDEKLLALYILFTPHRNPEGIFYLPLSYISADLRWTLRKVQKAINKLITDRFIFFDAKTNLMLIRNALKYQVPENPNQAESVMRRVKELPSSPLLQEFLELAKLHCYRKGAGSAAQAFCVRLAEVLAQRLPQELPQGLSEPLTLSETPTLTKNKQTLNRQAPALARELETPTLKKRSDVVCRGKRGTDEEDLPDYLREVESRIVPVANGIMGLRGRS